MRGGESHVELRADFPGGFPGHMRDAFTEAGRTDEENDVFDFVRTLLHLRKTHTALRRGRMIHYPPPFLSRPPWFSNVYKYLRMTAEEKILVVVNGNEAAQQVDLSEVAHWFSGSNRFLNMMTGETIAMDASQQIAVGGWGALIVQVVE